MSFTLNLGVNFLYIFSKDLFLPQGQGQVSLSTLRFSTLFHNDPAVLQDHCGRCRIRTRDLCPIKFVYPNIHDVERWSHESLIFLCFSKTMWRFKKKSTTFTCTWHRLAYYIRKIFVSLNMVVYKIIFLLSRMWLLSFPTPGFSAVDWPPTGCKKLAWFWLMHC